MPGTPAGKRHQLTLGQLSLYDDLLTDALVDRAFYWTTIPKNKGSYHPSRGVREEEITKIIQSHLVLTPDVDVALSKLLATDGLKRFCNSLKTPREKDDFSRHARRYLQIYLPDCPFEVSSTNRYTITTHEASISARKFIRRGEVIKYLSGIQVNITEEELEEIAERKKDFSIVVSSRSKCASLFMGPARFANHDCGSNAQLKTTNQGGMEVIATQNIEVGDEITVTYGDDYFGEDNCECLCYTCEQNLANGWAPEDGVAAVKLSVEDLAEEGYSLRRRRRDDSSARASRTPSIAPDVRPFVAKSRSKTLKIDSNRASMTGSPAPEALLRQKRKREYSALTTPPVTPAKRQKHSNHEIETVPVAADLAASRRSSDDGSSGQGSGSDSEAAVARSPSTDVTLPDEEAENSMLQSPQLTPTKGATASLKEEDLGVQPLSQVAPQPSVLEQGDAIIAAALPTIEIAAQAANPASGEIDAVGSSQDLPEAVELIKATPHTAVVAEEINSSPLETEEVETEDLEDPEDTETPKRGRGRPRGSGKTKDQAAAMETESTDILSDSATEKQSSPPPSGRVPGDYELTPLLLSGPYVDWIRCTICDKYFVQENSYYTRNSCPRCERHSKLYGFRWPKTQREGKHDKEERVLDHRTIHRFLDPEDEAKVRGRKRPGSFAARTPAEEVSMKGILGRKRKSMAEDDEDAQEMEGVRRSGRKRHPSLKASA